MKSALSPKTRLDWPCPVCETRRQRHSEATDGRDGQPVLLATTCSFLVKERFEKPTSEL